MKQPLLPCSLCSLLRSLFIRGHDSREGRKNPRREGRGQAQQKCLADPTYREQKSLARFEKISGHINPCHNSCCPRKPQIPLECGLVAHIPGPCKCSQPGSSPSSSDTDDPEAPFPSIFVTISSSRLGFQHRC